MVYRYALNAERLLPGCRLDRQGDRRSDQGLAAFLGAGTRSAPTTAADTSRDRPP